MKVKTGNMRANCIKDQYNELGKHKQRGENLENWKNKRSNERENIKEGKWMKKN